MCSVNFSPLPSRPDTAARAVKLFGPKPDGAAEHFAGATSDERFGGARTGVVHGKMRRVPHPGRKWARVRTVPRQRETGSPEAFAGHLEPDANPSAYQTSVVQQTDSELVFGLVSQSGPDVLLVRQPGGVSIFIPRTRVEDTFAQDWSLMPETPPPV